MNKARAASSAWREVSAGARSRRIGALRREIFRARRDIVREICAETGKTAAEALSSDVLPTLENLRYLEQNAPSLLTARKARGSLVFPARKARVEYRPRGVVLVIAPWNNPLQLSLIPAATALASGNTVVLKPSERTPATGRLMETLCTGAGLTGGEIQIAAGGPGLGEALIAERPDMIFFTGGMKNGRSVLAAAACHLIPVILELGGKNPMIVFDDANLGRAARGAVYGAFAHAGQHCVSVKRLYIHDTVYKTFLERVIEETRVLTRTSEWGRVIDSRAEAVEREQVREALTRGARLLVPQGLEQAGAEPTLVADATHDMQLMSEETFAPVLGAMRFETEEEALRLANDSYFGLNASVWTMDPGRSERVAYRLETGNVYVNNVLTNVGNPYLPFGGVKASGIGRYHGPEGVRAFCAETSVMISPSSRRTEPNWFPHGEDKREAVDELIKLRHGDLSWVRRACGWFRLFRRLS